MRCREAGELMSLWLDEALPAGQMRALNEHLLACPACQDEWVVLHRISSWLSDAPMVSPSPGFTTRVMSRVGQRQQRPRLVGGIVSLLLGAALASMLMTLLILPALTGLWQTANSPALAAGLEIVLFHGLRIFRSLGDAAWVIMRVLIMTWSHPLFMSYSLLVLLLTTVWVLLVKLQREKSLNANSLKS